MDITVRITKNYGLQTVYPACPAAELFAKIAGTVTLTPHALRDIAALGYQINVKQEEQPKTLEFNAA